MPRLAFISDHDLEEAVDKLLDKAHAALSAAEAKFSKNVIDPFAAVFEMAGFRTNELEWRAREKTRQAQKAFCNHLGTFHQDILGKVSGWQDLKSGKMFDLVSHGHKTIAEIKNKHNTLKGSDQAALYASLESWVMPKISPYKDYTAYYVVIVPRAPSRFDKPFVPSDKSTGKRKPENALVRTIDGSSFYHKVTGVPDALWQLFQVLPQVIQNSHRASGYEFDQFALLEEFFLAAYGKGE
jgi:hypothetical protein